MSRVVAAGAVAAILLSGCSSGAEPGGDAGQATTVPVAASPTPVRRETTWPDPVGPLAGLSWPAGSVPVDVMLHDDQRKLLAVTLEGEKTVLWRHPKTFVIAVAASPGGEQLAMSVNLQARGRRRPSSALYLLGRDGSVKTVDVVKGLRVIDSPVFLRSPTKFDDPPKLYWIRSGERVDDQGRLDGQAMVLTKDGPQPVEVPLRYAEAVYDLHGYPGAGTFTLSLFRKNNVPTRLEILKNEDYSQSTDSSVTLWGANESRANTDIFVGVAWVSPTDYVIPVAKDGFFDDFSLRFFRAGCEDRGSHVVYRGTEIDLGYREAAWRILPGGRDQVLVVGAEAAGQMIEGGAESAPWLAVGIPDGEITEPGARFERGPWTWVSKRSNVSPADDVKCGGFDWTWP